VGFFFSSFTMFGMANSPQLSSIVSPVRPDDVIPPPIAKQAIFFVDGQNLFWGAKREFGYQDPNYDIKQLCSRICGAKGWGLKQARFYTGIHDPSQNFRWNQFWQNKLRSMSRNGVEVFSRKLVYRSESIVLADGTTHQYSYSQEKGIDVRIAIDSLTMAFRQQFDVAVLVSRDQDLSEVAKDIRSIAAEQKRDVVVASAYPFNGVGRMHCIGRTEGIPIDRELYDACIDQTSYWPKR
jgi:uncharacterized LabA/DUF88 family protein